MTKIILGNTFICTKTIKSKDGKLYFKRGDFYYSQNEGCITDKKGNREHHIDGKFYKKHFVKLTI